MKPSNPILLSIIAASFFMAFQSSANAEKWSAIGILTTQVHDEPANAHYVEIDDFETEELQAGGDP